MRKMIAALAAAGLLLTSACDHKPVTAGPTWEAPSPKVTFPALPAGLIATADLDDRSELRIYSPASGHLLRKFAMPLITGTVALSDDYGYAADIDPDSHEIHFSVRRGDTFKAVTDWSIAMLDLQDQSGLQVRPEGFQPGTDQYTVEVDRIIEGEGYSVVEDVTFDPAQPTTTMQYDTSPPVVGGADGPQSVEVPALHAHAHVDVVKGAPVSADIIADSARPGVNPFLFTCGGQPIAKFELACTGGDKAEIGALIVDPPQSDGAFQSLGKLPGKPFSGVFASPDGKRLLAQRPDGFYALPADGGTPKKVFGTLAGGEVTVLRWSGSR
jgi:hypothetical protein